MKPNERPEDRLWGRWSERSDALKSTDEELLAIRDRFASKELSVEGIEEATSSLRKLDQRYEHRNKIKRRVALIATVLSGFLFDRVVLAMGWIRPEWLLSFHIKRLWHYLVG